MGTPFPRVPAPLHLGIPAHMRVRNDICFVAAKSQTYAFFSGGLLSNFNASYRYMNSVLNPIPRLMLPWASERGAGGVDPWILKTLAQKGYFLNFEWEKPTFTTFDPPWTNFGKIPSWPPWKISFLPP